MLWRNAKSILEPLMDTQGYYTWTFDPLFPVDVRFYTYNRRKHLRPNRHAYFELFYLSHGDMMFQIHSQTFKMRAGDLMVIGSQFFHCPVEHGFSAAKGIVLCFLPKLILGKEPFGEDLQYLMPFLSQDETFPHLIPARTGIPAKVLNLIKLIQGELPAKTVRSRLNAKTYLKMILVLLGNHYAGHQGKLRQFQNKLKNIERLRPVLEFIDDHLSERVPVDEAASLVNMSKSRFVHFFKNVTGQAFISYLNHLRVTRAEWLLASTDLPLADLCHQLGFCDQSYFGMTFRKSVGMTPSQYRRKFSEAQADSRESQKSPQRSRSRLAVASPGLQKPLPPTKSDLLHARARGPIQ